MKPLCVVSLAWLCVGCVGIVTETGTGEPATDDGGTILPPSGEGEPPTGTGGAGGGSTTGGSGGTVAGGSGGSGGRGGAGGTAPRPDAAPARPLDGGASPMDSGAAPGPDAISTAVVCTSNKMYRSGTGPSMRPGDACPRCHGFAIAGTVYPTLHEPNNCNGVNGSGMTVVITDANGGVHNINVNSVGNFYLRGNIPKPFKAKVIVDGRERAMTLPQTNGACNSCHTTQGANLAPGRIMAP